MMPCWNLVSPLLVVSEIITPPVPSDAIWEELRDLLPDLPLSARRGLLAAARELIE